MNRIESTSVVDSSLIIGDNCYIGNFSIIRPNVVIGNNTEIRAYCFIANNATIGNNVKIIQFSSICQYIIIEDDVFIGAGTMTANTKNITHRRKNMICNVEAPIIKKGVRIGAGCVICPGIMIGENCVIGAGSVVTKDTEEGYIYFGNPAKKIKPVSIEEII